MNSTNTLAAAIAKLEELWLWALTLQPAALIPGTIGNDRRQ
jgi:hypothetical protein